MSLLEKLTFAATTKKAETSQPNLVLRRKMVTALDDQIAGAQAETAGQPFAKERQRWMPKEDGGKELRAVQSALRKFWFRDTQNRVLVEVRFGNKPISIKGQPSIVVGDMANLVNVLTLLRDAVMAGELDAELAAASEHRRKVRKGKTGKPVGTTTTNGSATAGTQSPGNAAKAMFMRNGK
ncbi:conserved hypothetical protein [Azospirillaceae bacterium]